MRYHPKTDKNQTAIVQELRELGCGVLILAAVGNGCPDLLVSNGLACVLMEVKNLDGRGTSLTPSEAQFHARWPGSIAIVTDLAGALKALGGIR